MTARTYNYNCIGNYNDNYNGNYNDNYNGNCNGNYNGNCNCKAGWNSWLERFGRLWWDQDLRDPSRCSG